jgi:hypothetical protein
MSPFFHNLNVITFFAIFCCGNTPAWHKKVKSQATTALEGCGGMFKDRRHDELLVSTRHESDDLIKNISNDIEI